MHKNILLGMLLDEENIEKIISSFLEYGLKCTVMTRHTKLGVKNELSTNNDIDVLILSEKLENIHPYTPEEIDNLIDLRDNIIIIPILNKDKRGSDYVSQLYSIGMYTAIFDDDSAPNNVVELIKNGRKKREAKIYYGINNDKLHHKNVSAANSISDNDKLRKIISYFVKNTEVTLEEKLSHVSSMLTSDEFIKVLSLLPLDMQKTIQVIPGYETYFNDNNHQEVKKLQNKKVLSIVSVKNKVINLLERPVVNTNKVIDLSSKLQSKLKSLLDKNKNETENISESSNSNTEEVYIPKNDITSTNTDISDNSDTGNQTIENDTNQDISKDSIAIDKKSKRKIKREITNSQRNKRKKELLNFEITVTIAICSLSHGAGCTHLVKTLSYFIRDELKKKVCIVRYYVKDDDIQEVDTFNHEDIYMLHEKYDFIILDVGPYEPQVHKEVKIAALKIMCSVLNQSSLKLLADFIREEDNPTKWKYFFNHVPPNKISEVSDLMEDYQHLCMPLYDCECPNEDMKEVLRNLVYGRKL